MKKGDRVRINRDVPRIGTKTGDTATVMSDKGGGHWEIAFPPTLTEQRNLVVRAEWVEAIPCP